MSNQTKLPTADDVKESKTDEYVGATIESVEISTWADEIDNPESLAKFDNPDGRVLVLTIATDDDIKFKKTINYPESFTDKSLLGRFLNKWGSVDEGTEFEAYYDSEGFLQLLKPIK